MEKFVIEDALYLFESIKENKMISYDDNLINSSNNKINNDKLNYIDKNIKGFDGLDSSSILSLNIQRFAQRESTLPKVKEKITSNSYIDVTNDWVEKSKGINKKIKIFQKNEIFEYNGKKYLVDNHYVKYREKTKEIKFADWLSKNTRLKIQLNPEVEYPENVSVADCTFYKNDTFLGNYDMKILSDKSKDILEENELLKKEFEEYKKNSQDKIEKLKSSNQSLISNVNNLEKAKRLLENKTISLRNDLRIEQQKNNTDLLTIKTLQNKFKNFEQAKKEIDEENEKNRELYEESEYTKQINQLISDMQEKNTTICVLNQEILELNEKFKFKSILTKNKIIEFTVDGRYHDYQTEILQLKEEIRRRDRDIAFLKNAYNDISLKSEEEYNTVSSSLYELAFHLTKIKDNVIPSSKKITSNNSNLDSPS